MGATRTDANIKASVGSLFGEAKNQQLPEGHREKPVPVLSGLLADTRPPVPHPSLSACLLWLGYPAPPFLRTFVLIFFRPVRQGRVLFPQNRSCACESHCGCRPESPVSLSSCKLQRQEGKWGVCQHQPGSKAAPGEPSTPPAQPLCAGAAATFRRC